jgi:hypothetical protein
MICSPVEHPLLIVADSGAEPLFLLHAVDVHST